MNRHEYAPEVGDKVAVLEHDGTFLVTAVDREAKSVSLRLLLSEDRLEHIPWSVLVSLQKMTLEDVEQAAARIVREATRDS